jgi:hypothetical protein
MNQHKDFFPFTPISISALVIGDGSYGSPSRAAKPVPQVDGRGFPLYGGCQLLKSKEIFVLIHLTY